MSDTGQGAGRRITVRSISCRGVRSFVPFQRPPIYAAVSLGGCREKTQADSDGGENPDWDGAVFTFDLDGAGAGGDGLLRFEVKAQVPLLGNRLVGTACVPVADLGGGDGAVPRHVSYQVCAPDGKPNGTLSFAYAITGSSGGAGTYQQVRPAQDLSSCCAPPAPPPPSSAAYPTPAMPNFAPHSGSYPPAPSPSAPASASLYPPVQDLLPPSSYPPPPPPPLTMDSLFPAPNFAPNSSYPPPPALCTAHPPPPAWCISSSAPSYPPTPASYYPPPLLSGYPPRAPMNPEFPSSNFPPPTSSYPPPPPPESGSYPVLPKSMPPPAPSSVDRALPYMEPPLQDSTITYPELTVPPLSSGGSYYPPPGTRRPEEAGRTTYYYTQPGTRYS